LEAKEVFYLLAAVAALTVIVVPIIFEVWEPFKKYPNFDVNLEPPTDLENKFVRLTVENNGQVQARNGAIYVMSKEPIQIKRTICPEGLTKLETANTLSEIRFQKMSINIECIVDFQSLSNGRIYKIAITADGVPGFNYNVDPPLDFNKTAAEYLMDEQEKLIEKIEQKNTPNEFLANVALALLVVAVITFTTKYFSVRSAERTKESEKIRLQESLKDQESEIVNELNRFVDELEYLDNAISMQPRKEIPMHTVKRRDWLIERISQLTNERDQIRGRMLAEKDLHILIGDFFENWSSLEQQIAILGTKVSGRRIKSPNIN